MTATITDHDQPTAQASAAGGGAAAGVSVLPELRTTWWETGLKARAEAGILVLVTELPRLVASALRISWRADRTRTLIVMVGTVVAGLMASFGLLATSRVLVRFFAAGPTPDRVVAALPALAVLTVVSAVRAGMTLVIGYAENGLSPLVSREVERSLFEVTTAVRLEAFDADAFADDMERAARANDAATQLVSTTIDLFAGLAGVLAVAAAVLFINPWLLIALLVATVPGTWAVLAVGHLRYRIYVAGSVRRRRLLMLHRLMAERDSATELRTYGLRSFLLDQYDRVMDVETGVRAGLVRRTTMMSSAGALVGGVAVGGVYVLLGLLLLHGQIPLSAAATCVIALQTARSSLTSVTYQIDHIYTQGQQFSDYTGFMKRAVTQLPGGDQESPTDSGGAGTVATGSEAAPGATTSAAVAGPLVTLEVRGVSLWYPDREVPAVRDLTIRIEAGKTIAVVGENGSGKSTLAAMIAGLRAPTEGTITWNGVALPELDVASVQARIAVVTQNYYHWPFTAATNIAIGDVTSTPEQRRIEAAAVRAVAHDMIRELPHGYETLLDRTFAHGQDLSGGQWQRITAARGFLRDAELLIMDEPSAALDPRAEHALFQAIRDRQGRATTILITHRLANVRHADVIYVLDRGQLQEMGRHDDLLAANGRYAELFKMQAEGYARSREQRRSPAFRGRASRTGTARRWRRIRVVPGSAAA
jgi:ATP-binding cassette subfamily B protein